MNSLGDVRVTLKDLGQQRSQSRSSLTQRWQLLIRRLQTRRALADLNDAQLRDIGLTREQAQAEASLPFWKL